MLYSSNFTLYCKELLFLFSSHNLLEKKKQRHSWKNRLCEWLISLGTFLGHIYILEWESKNLCIFLKQSHKPGQPLLYAFHTFTCLSMNLWIQFSILQIFIGIYFMPSTILDAGEITETQTMFLTSWSLYSN